MVRLTLFAATLLLGAALGCAGTPAQRPAREAPASLGHGYALLHEILGQERQVSKVLIIKEERDELQKVIDAISKTCGAAYDRLEELAEENPRLDLSDTGLPVQETRTRKAIADARRDQLLAASGREFELDLLLTQNEALVYSSHLTDTLARSESDPERLEFLRTLWKELTRLQGDVRTLLRHPAKAGA